MTRKEKASLLLAALMISWALAELDAGAASGQLKPILKAIDPSQAKTDTVAPPLTRSSPPSPNPLGRITGAPVTSPGARRPAAARPPRPAEPPAATAPPPEASDAGAPPEAYLPQAGYPPPAPARPAQGRQQPAASGYTPAMSYGLPPFYQGPEASTAAGRYAPPPAGGAPPAPEGGFPSEDLIPEFGKELPVSRQPAASQNYGPGFVTQPPVAPRVYTPAPPAVTPDERRITRLEQIAFGSTYPEHELEDRVDHLEREVLGSTNSGSVDERLAKLEGKLAGEGAFGSAGAPPFAVAPATAGSAPVVPRTGGAIAYGTSAPSTAPRAAQRASTRPAAAAAGSPDFTMVVNSIPSDPSAGDYLSQIKRFAGGAVARWNHFPVKIRLPRESPQSWATGLEAGVKKWGQYIPLTIVPANEAADIEVVWVNHLPPKQLGITRLQQVIAGVPQVIVFMLRPTYYLPEIPERTLQPVFLHELGHGLGILGHSDSHKDIMQPAELALFGARRTGKTIRVRFGSITARDVNTLKRIYELPALPPTFSLTQPLEWSMIGNSGRSAHGGRQ